MLLTKEYNLNFNPACEKKNLIMLLNLTKIKNQIEMYLKSNTKQEIQSQNEKIEINSGEKILTEISRKFSDSAIIEIF